MKSPLALTIAAANRAGMTYGAYVSRYGTAIKETPEQVKPNLIRNRCCALCGIDISHRGHNAKYCIKCAYIAQKQAQDNHAARRREKARNI